MGAYIHMPPHGNYEPPTIKLYPDTLVRAPEDVTALIRLLEAQPLGLPVAVDTETTGLYPHEHDVIRGVSIAFTDAERMHSFYLPVGYPIADQNIPIRDQQRIFHALKARDPFLVLHHGKFDFAFLRQLPMGTDGSVFFSFPKPDEWWDTKVVAWLLDENLSSGLKEQAAFWWGEDQKDEQTAIKALIKERGGWDKLTAHDTATYAAKDAELTLRLFFLQEEKLVDGDEQFPAVRPAILRELAIQGVLARMERTGILLDQNLLEEMRERTAKRIAEIEASFSINLASTLQVAKMLDDMGALPADHPRTPKGKPKMSRDALESLDDESHPALGLIMEHRRLCKAMSGYFVPLAKRIGHDERIHPTFWSMGTVTGRFSCSDPNLQTIPRADTLPGVRDVFIAEDGFELWEYDLQAAEKRVIAGMAKQQNLIDALNEGTDVHGALAALVFGDDYSSLQRRYAKNIGYGWDYGLTSVKTAAKYIKGADGEKIARKILDGLKKMYPNVARMMNRKTRIAQRDGWLPTHDDPATWPGRFRRFQTPSKRRPAPFTALNFQIQGGIGELMKDVMLEVEEPLAFWGARMCLQVHDSLVIEVRDGTGDYVQGVLQGALDRVNPFDMRMLFDGKPWGDHD